MLYIDPDPSPRASNWFLLSAIHCVELPCTCPCPPGAVCRSGLADSRLHSHKSVNTAFIWGKKNGQTLPCYCAEFLFSALSLSLLSSLLFVSPSTGTCVKKSGLRLLSGEPGQKGSRAKALARFHPSLAATSAHFHCTDNILGQTGPELRRFVSRRRVVRFL